MIKLSEQISYYLSLIERTGEDTKDVYCVQAKEKFGELRFYMTQEDIVISALIDYASLQSRLICQSCGEKATKVTAPWISYLCDKCYELQTADNGK